MFSRKQSALLARALKYLMILISLALLSAFAYSSSKRLLNTESMLAKTSSDISLRLKDANNQKIEEKINKDYSLLATRSIFGELKPIESETTKTTAPQVSNATLVLLGTFMEEGSEPYAIIADKASSEQEIFNLEDAIFNAAKLVKIYPEKVEIDRNGSIEVLILDETYQSSGSPSAGSGGSGQVIQVNEGELDQALENLPLLLTQARAVPYFKDGQSVGLRLFAIKKDSLFEKIGLKNGDILKSINGNSLGDITQAVKLFEKLKEEKSIGLTLERGKEDVEFKYRIG